MIGKRAQEGTGSAGPFLEGKTRKRLMSFQNAVSNKNILSTSKVMKMA
jgi:hypothetical protein